MRALCLGILLQLPWLIGEIICDYCCDGIASKSETQWHRLASSPLSPPSLPRPRRRSAAYHSAPAADLQPPHKRCCSLHASACKPLPPPANRHRVQDPETPESSIQLGLPEPYLGYATAPAGVVLSGVLPKRCSDSSPPPRSAFVSASASAATLSACCSSRRAAKPPSRSLATRPGSACNTGAKDGLWHSFGVQLQACCSNFQSVLQLVERGKAAFAQLGDGPRQRLRTRGQGRFPHSFGREGEVQCHCFAPSGGCNARIPVEAATLGSQWRLQC